VGAMLSQNVIGKNDQLKVYASRLLNKGEQNYNTIEIKALAMVFSLHKFKHYLLVFYVRSYGIGVFGQQTISFKENN
jgi:hypothetical protein